MGSSSGPGPRFAASIVYVPHAPGAVAVGHRRVVRVPEARLRPQSPQVSPWPRGDDGLRIIAHLPPSPKLSFHFFNFLNITTPRDKIHRAHPSHRAVRGATGRWGTPTPLMRPPPPPPPPRPPTTGTTTKGDRSTKPTGQTDSRFCSSPRKGGGWFALHLFGRQLGVLARKRPS